MHGTESPHPRQGQAGGVKARGVKAARLERRSSELVTLKFVVSRQRLGQHFLTNASCQRIIRAIFGSAAAAPEYADSLARPEIALATCGSKSAPGTAR